MLKWNKQFFKFTFLLLLGICLLSQSNAQTGKLTNLGPQVFASVIQGSVFVEDSTGEEYVYTVVRGRPAYLIGYSLNSLEKVLEKELPGTDGAWALEVASDGLVYVAAANGMLYQYVPGTNTLTDLGRALPGEKVIWDLEAAENGAVFGGTYPGARVFRYHPKEGFSDAGKGTLLKNENYVRSVAYHKKSGKIYAGIASHSALVELDPSTGEKKQLLPEKDRDQEAIYHLKIITGLPGGDRLFGWLTGPVKRVTVCYNLETKQFEDLMPSIDVRSLIKSPIGSKVYYTAGGKLYVVDYDCKSFKSKELTVLDGETKAIKWGKGKLLYILTAHKSIYTYDPKIGRLTTNQLNVPQQPIDIQSIHFGPDHKIWSAGYLVGGHGTYDPVTGETKQYVGLDQTEGFGKLGTSMYYGIYAKARLYAYDTKKVWDLKQNNPKLLGAIEGQDRPFAVLGIEKLNKVFFGTVPGYGKLGGVLVEYDVVSKRIEMFSDIIPNQSIVSLTESGTVVFGGTSIFGGLGGKPIEKEGKIFAWDPVNREKIFEMVPVAGKMSVTGLTTMPDGNIWAFADGDLIVFNPLKRQVLSKHNFFQINYMPSHIWRNAFIKAHPSGYVYICVNNKLYKVNPSSMKVTEIEDKVSLLAMDKEGRLYFRRNTDLWRYEP